MIDEIRRLLDSLSTYCGCRPEIQIKMPPDTFYAFKKALGYSPEANAQNATVHIVGSDGGVATVTADYGDVETVRRETAERENIELRKDKNTLQTALESERNLNRFLKETNAQINQVIDMLKASNDRLSDPAEVREVARLTAEVRRLEAQNKEIRGLLVSSGAGRREYWQRLQLIANIANKGEC